MNKKVKLVSTWIDLQSLPEGSNEAEAAIWAADEVFDLVLKDPDTGWQFVTDVVAATDDEWVLANLAAGPLEDLLGKYPQETIVRLEHEVKNNEKFRQVIGGVWKNIIPEEIWARLQSLNSH